MQLVDKLWSDQSSTADHNDFHDCLLQTWTLLLSCMRSVGGAWYPTAFIQNCINPSGSMALVGKRPCLSRPGIFRIRAKKL